MRQCISLIGFQVSAGEQLFRDLLCVTLGKCGHWAFKYIMITYPSLAFTTV
jgi:hypothetical protein